MKKRYQVIGVLGVGIAPEDRKIIEQIRKYNALDGVPFFYLEGEMDPKKMNGILRFFMETIVSRGKVDHSDVKLARKVLAENATIKPERLQEIITWYQKQVIEKVQSH